MYEPRCCLSCFSVVICRVGDMLHKDDKERRTIRSLAGFSRFQTLRLIADGSLVINFVG